MTTPCDLEANLIRLREASNARLGQDLLSLTLYGSAARGLYQPGASDINLLVVLTSVDVPALTALREALTGACGPLRVAPYVLTAEELPRVSEAFPTRILDMKRGYRVLHGADVLAGLTVDPAVLASRCRQELLNLVLRFRHVLLGPMDQNALETALHQFVPPLIKVLRTLVYLRTGDHIDDRARLVAAATKALALPAGVFAQLVAWRQGHVAFSGEDWKEAALGLFAGLQQVSAHA